LTLVAAIVYVGGCEKENKNPSGVDPCVVVLTGADLKPDGSIKPTGIEKVQAKSNAPSVTVAFFREPLSDAGLEQLSKFPNIRRVEAIGSRITPAGIDKFKAAIPQAEVVR